MPWWDTALDWIGEQAAKFGEVVSGAVQTVSDAFQRYVWDFGEGEAVVEEAVKGALEWAETEVVRPLIDIARDVSDTVVGYVHDFTVQANRVIEGIDDWFGQAKEWVDDIIDEVGNDVDREIIEQEDEGEENIRRLPQPILPPIIRQERDADESLGIIERIFGTPLLWILHRAIDYIGEKIVDFLFERE